ncbi:fimbria/pilus outer membrane usher protein [Pseudoroseomonas globiformis]|uniref:Fimbria/pilus outer membrane usher protein n=1 Tax=Teichococcus globiformis TaxID=2307229 RepID=A0ABV7G060_9PROT
MTGLLAFWAIGPALAAERVMLLDVVVNGQSRNTIGTFTERDGVVAARAVDLGELGIVIPSGTAAPEAEIPLRSLPGVSFSIDEPNQRISFTADDRALLAAELGAASAARAATASVAENRFGALVNYDINVTSSAGRTLGAGYFDGRLFGPPGVLSTNFLGYTESGPYAEPVVRLDSTFVRENEGALRRYEVGDFIGGGLGWTRPVRLGGVRVSSDFALRPDLVTFPVPVVTGSAAVPSTVDVLVNGVQQLSTSTGTGPFVIRQLPVVTGAGQVAVVLRDALGRETVSSLPFYASSALLAPGLLAYSAELGWVRRNYGLVSNDYGTPVAMGTARFGVNDWLTVEGHAEGGSRLAMGGGGVVLALGGFGVLSAAVAASQAQGERGEDSGWQASFGFERVTTGISFGASVTWASRGFADVAALDGSSYPRSIARASLSLPVAGGSFAMAFAGVERDTGLQRPRQGERELQLPGAAILSATYSRTLFGNVTLYGTAFTDMSGQGGTGALFGVTFPFGQRSTASANASLDQGRGYGGVQMSQGAVTTGDFGWRAYSSAGGITRQLAEAEYKASTGRIMAGIDQFGPDTALRGGLRGAITTIGGGTYLSDTVQNSFAVVDTGGLPDVTILQENRPVGRTDSRGRLLVPNLRPHERNRIGVAPDDLPADAVVADTTRMVSPRNLSGLVVRFPIDRASSARIRLVDAQGVSLPLGSIATLATDAGMPPGERLPVGYDGEVFATGLTPRNRLDLRLPGGGICAAEFEFTPAQNDLPLLGPVPCR